MTDDLQGWHLRIERTGDNRWEVYTMGKDHVRKHADQSSVVSTADDLYQRMSLADPVPHWLALYDNKSSILVAPSTTEFLPRAVLCEGTKIQVYHDIQPHLHMMAQQRSGQ